MSPDETLKRAAEAQRILNEPIYQEAWQVTRAKIVSRLEADDLPEVDRKHLNYLLVALKRVQHHLETVMIAGKEAAREIDRKQTMLERAKVAAGRFR